MEDAARDTRPAELRQEYESSKRAGHYRDNRWTRSPRARRTDAKEQAIVGQYLQQVGESTRILDLPCGTGRFRQLLQTNTSELLSIDASREMLAATPPKHGLQASAHAIPLLDDAVDMILCSRLLHHFEHSEQRKAVLQELARVSSGHIILSYFDAANFQAWRNRIRKRFRGRFPISRTTFSDEIQSAGLIEVTRTYIARGISEQVWVLLRKASS
ncbi:MAG: class I SAM-dependent methyltransferase [Planctomycetota bacterium]